MKYINFKRHKFSTVVKNFNTLILNLLKVFKLVKLPRYEFRKISRYLNIIKNELKKLTIFAYPKNYSFDFIRKINFFTSKFLLLHLPLSIIFFAFLYLLIPTFYNYDKSTILNQMCKSKNIECVIAGKINYTFYPTPRLKIKEIIVNSISDQKKTIITANQAIIKLSIKNLLAKEKHKFKKIKLNNFEINFNLKDLSKYKKILINEIEFIPIVFANGKIIFFDEKKYVTSIEDGNVNFELKKRSKNIKLKGKFLNSSIHATLNSQDDDEPTTKVLLKIPALNLLTKASFFDYEKNKNNLKGNILIKKNKLRFTGIFDYKDNEFKINKSNFRNSFLDGKLEGIIKFIPFFDFDLDLDLNSINFTKLYTNFLALNKKDQKEFFKISKKINGKLNLSSDKIYSSYNLVKSLESRIKFNNGSILVDQFLINLGKLGAADLSGSINNDKKFTNFKYESNIFVDNKKKFLSKFGIFNKVDFPTNFFISGNFDLDNTKATFYEISDNNKLSTEDINFIEKEFNEYMFENDFDTLFLFPRFKEFIKSITSEIE